MGLVLLNRSPWLICGGETGRRALGKQQVEHFGNYGSNSDAREWRLGLEQRRGWTEADGFQLHSGGSNKRICKSTGCRERRKVKNQGSLACTTGK